MPRTPSLAPGPASGETTDPASSGETTDRVSSGETTAPWSAGARADARAGTPRDVAWLSLRLGVLGFGGGYALIAQARHQVVERDRWLGDSEFLEQVAVASAVPGGTAANLMTLLGLRVGGVGTATVALLLFILPSALLLGVCAAYYDQARQVGPIEAVLVGLAPGVVAIVIAVAVRLAGGLRARWQWGLAALAFAVVALRWLGVLPVIVLTALGALLVRRLAPGRAGPALRAVPLLELTWVFAQISLSMFGGGLVMIAAIHQHLVDRLHWLDAQEFADAIALSQLTPGPIATIGGFIGYRLAGWPGSLAANVGVFLPAYLLTLLAARLLARHGQHPDLKAVLAALSAATVGMVLSAAVTLARTGPLAGPQAGPPVEVAVSALVIAIGLAALLWKRVNPLWVLSGSALTHVAAAPLWRG